MLIQYKDLESFLKVDNHENQALSVRQEEYPIICKLFCRQKCGYCGTFPGWSQSQG